MDALNAAAVDRYVDERLDQLPGRLGVVLASNPERREILAGALREAVLVGYSAQLGSGRTYPPQSEEEAWDRWMTEHERFDEVGAPANFEGKETAERLVQNAARTLDVAGGWGVTRALRAAARDAVVAGALLAAAVTRPPEEREQAAEEREAHYALAPHDMVRVAHAPNLPLAEMLQSRLLEAGIPSTRRAGNAEAYLGASSFCEIYVARADEQRALRLLEPASGPELGKV